MRFSIKKIIFLVKRIGQLFSLAIFEQNRGEVLAPILMMSDKVEELFLVLVFLFVFLDDLALNIG